MKLAHETALRQTTGLKQTLGLEARRAIGFLSLSNTDLTELLREAASDNPVLRLRLPPVVSNPVEAEAQGPSLSAHVLAQLPRLVPRAPDQRVALALAEALDGAGFVTQPLDQIAARLGCTVARVAQVLRALQQIEPRGLFARSLAECLALQLAERGPIDPEMQRVLDHLPSLAGGGVAALAVRTGVSDARLAMHLAQLRDLDPRPAAAFAQDLAATRVPDLIFSCEAGIWQALLNPETLPQAWLDPALLGTIPRGSALSHNRQQARHLLRALDQRNRALLALGAVLARAQAGFLAQGAAVLAPLTMRQVAQEIGMHESSVGRMVNSGSARTPAGIVPLRAFFSRPASRSEEGTATSAAAVIARLQALIAAETTALSDAALCDVLGAAGVQISRRVVAKYRAQAGIPPAHLRRGR
ncbi:MAG: RNA polymerase sigma-54 factor [Paracoccaceae bacterium]|nr:RNA polymerase sigma-54 factor [Paracoccaceae bacterium]